MKRAGSCSSVTTLLLAVAALVLAGCGAVAEADDGAVEVASSVRSDAGDASHSDAGEPSEPEPAAPPESIDDLMPLATGRTHSAVTPMGIYFEELVAHVVTEAESAFLADAAQSPPVPETTSTLHLESFPVDLYPSGGPVPSDVQQHAIGDCSADSVMASLAYLAPGFVKSRIVERHDGTFSVRLFDPMAQPIVVNVDTRFVANTQNQLVAATSRAGHADWATVLEKAVMKYLTVFPVVGGIGGIGSEFVSPIFTGDGDSFAFPPGVLSKAQIPRAARALLAQGKVIIGGFNAVMPVGPLKTVTAHAYAVFVPATSDTLLSMRNPWGASPLVSGGHDRSQDGVVNVPSTDSWASAVDMRVIEPGAAAGGGATAPYIP